MSLDVEIPVQQDRTTHSIMPLKFFTVPAFDPAAAEAEINAFLGRHRIVAIDRRWVEDRTNSFWAVCIDYLAGGSNESRRGLPPARNRIDYKQVLSPDEFAVFSQLREFRKEIAQAEAVPVYAVFTNEQLAQAVQQKCRTAADLKRIEGIGEARIEKYSERLLAILSTLPEMPDAPSGEPV